MSFYISINSVNIHKDQPTDFKGGHSFLKGISLISQEQLEFRKKMQIKVWSKTLWYKFVLKNIFVSNRFWDILIVKVNCGSVLIAIAIKSVFIILFTNLFAFVQGCVELFQRIFCLFGSYLTMKVVLNSFQFHCAEILQTWVVRQFI